MILADVGYHISHQDLLAISYSLRAFRLRILEHTSGGTQCGVTLFTFSPITFWYTTEHDLSDSRQKHTFTEMFTRIESSSILSSAVEIANRLTVEFAIRIPKRFTHIIILTKWISNDEMQLTQREIHESLSLGINVCVCGVITTSWTTSITELSALFENQNDASCIATASLLDSEFSNNYFRVYHDCIERFLEIVNDI